MCFTSECLSYLLNVPNLFIPKIGCLLENESIHEFYANSLILFVFKKKKKKRL